MNENDKYIEKKDKILNYFKSLGLEKETLPFKNYGEVSSFSSLKPAYKLFYKAFKYIGTQPKMVNVNYKGQDSFEVDIVPKKNENVYSFNYYTFDTLDNVASKIADVSNQIEFDYIPSNNKTIQDIKYESNEIIDNALKDNHILFSYLEDVYDLDSKSFNFIKNITENLKDDNWSKDNISYYDKLNGFLGNTGYSLGLFRAWYQDYKENEKSNGDDIEL